jgi:hypothetical protein
LEGDVLAVRGVSPASAMALSSWTIQAHVTRALPPRRGIAYERMTDNPAKVAYL